MWGYNLICWYFIQAGNQSLRLQSYTKNRRHFIHITLYIRLGQCYAPKYVQLCMYNKCNMYNDWYNMCYSILLQHLIQQFDTTFAYTYTFPISQVSNTQLFFTLTMVVVQIQQSTTGSNVPECTNWLTLACLSNNQRLPVQVERLVPDTLTEGVRFNITSDFRGQTNE